MLTYFKMKMCEWKIKLAFYSSIKDFLDNKDAIISTVKNIFDSVKDLNGDELRTAFIDSVGRAIVEMNNDDKQEEKSEGSPTVIAYDPAKSTEN